MKPMTDEYIRKADAIDEVNHALDRETILFSFVRKVAISALKKMPSADVAPVVRCKDCLFFTTEKSCCRPEGLIKARENAFCSYGERRKI